MDEETLLDFFTDMIRSSIVASVLNIADILTIIDSTIDRLVKPENVSSEKARIDYIIREVSKELSKYLSKKLLMGLVTYEVATNYSTSKNYDEFKQKVVEAVYSVKSRYNIPDNVFESIKEIFNDPVVEESFYESKEESEQFELSLPIHLIIEDELVELEQDIDVSFLQVNIQFDKKNIRELVYETIPSQRTLINKYLIVSISPKWYFFFKDKKELKMYIRKRVIKTLLTILKSLDIKDNAITLDEIAKKIARKKKIDLTALSNEELLKVLEKVISEIENEEPGEKADILSDLLAEMSRRVLSKDERKRFTELLTDILRSINSDQHKSHTEKLKIRSLADLISANVHNIELTDDLIREIMKISVSYADTIYKGKAEEIGEADPFTAIKLLAEAGISRKYKELLFKYIELAKQLKLSTIRQKVTGRKRIDYTRTMFATVKYRVPKLIKYDELKGLSNIAFVIDMSGSMFTEYKVKFDKHIEERVTQVKMALLTAYIFMKALEEFGYDNIRIYLFANKIIDVSNYTVDTYLKIVDNPHILSNVIGAGTELTGTLMKLPKIIEPETTVFLITDTGDASVTPELVRFVKEKFRDFIVVCPERALETKRTFKDANVEIIEFLSFEELFEKLAKRIENMID